MLGSREIVSGGLASSSRRRHANDPHDQVTRNGGHASAALRTEQFLTLRYDLAEAV